MRFTAPEKLKTIIRHPMAKGGDDGTHGKTVHLENFIGTSYEAGVTSIKTRPALFGIWHGLLRVQRPGCRRVAVIKKASEFLSSGATVCAICGATVALASFGLLDKRPHTSNGPGFLEMFAPSYKGQSFYIDKPSVADNNLITASCTGALLWAKQIIEHLGVFQSNTLESWYEYFSTGEPEHFFALMQTLPSGNEN